MKKSMVLLVISLFLFFPLCAANAQELIGRVNEYPPFYYTLKGEWKGINVDAYRALEAQSGVQIVLESIPWSRALKYMKTRPIVIGQLTPTKERQKTMHFIGPHSQEEVAIAMNRIYLAEKINSLDDLLALIKKTGKKVGYQNDIFYTQEFHERILNDPDFQSGFSNLSQYDTMIKMIERNRLLGFIEIKASLVYRLNIFDKNRQLGIHSYILGSSDVYFGVSKTISSDTLTRLRKANKELIADGTYRKIAVKWSHLKE